MKWLRVSEMFIGYHLCYTRGNPVEKIFNSWRKTRWYKVIRLEHVQVGKHPTTDSNWIFYHCKTHWPICSLEWFQTWYSDRKVRLRAPIRCYLDSILPGRSGLFTTPEAWLLRPSHLQPEGAEVRHIRENRGQEGWVGWRAEVVKDAAQVCNRCRECPL